jgi:hypothetical protein
MPFLVVPMLDGAQEGRAGVREAYSPRAAELYFLETVDDLMEVEDEMGAVRNKETAGAVETCVALNGRTAF